MLCYSLDLWSYPFHYIVKTIESVTCLVNLSDKVLEASIAGGTNRGTSRDDIWSAWRSLWRLREMVMLFERLWNYNWERRAFQQRLQLSNGDENLAVVPGVALVYITLLGISRFDVTKIIYDSWHTFKAAWYEIYYQVLIIQEVCDSLLETAKRLVSR